MPAPGPSRWMTALTAFVLGSLVTILLAGGAFYAYERSRRSPEPAKDARPVFTRPEFTRRVMDRTEAEVIQAVGKPDETTDDNDAKYWHFKKRTRDPLTRAEDSDVQVVIKGGKVTDVNY